jgi:hypothetical protein
MVESITQGDWLPLCLFNDLFPSIILLLPVTAVYPSVAVLVDRQRTPSSVDLHQVALADLRKNDFKWCTSQAVKRS